MLASELIEELGRAIREHGDREITFRDSEWGVTEVEGVEGAIENDALVIW